MPSCPPRLALLWASAPPGWGGHPCSSGHLFPKALAWLREDLVLGWGEGKTLNRLFPNEVWRQLERGRILLFSCLLLSPARGGGDVSSPPSSADLLPLLFPFCAVPKAFWQGSDFCAHSSVLKEKRGKTKGLEAWGGWWRGGNPAACPGQAGGAWGRAPGAGFALRTRGGLVASFSGESLASLWPPLLGCTTRAPCRFAGHASLEGRAGKTRFIPPPAKWWKTKGILTLCSWSWDVKICIASSWSLAFPQHPGHVGKVQDLGVLGQKAGEPSGIKNCDILLNRTNRPSPGKLKHLLLLLHYCKQQQRKSRQKLYGTMSVSFFQDK